jgi:hypothetical protein
MCVFFSTLSTLKVFVFVRQIILLKAFELLRPKMFFKHNLFVLAVTASFLQVQGQNWVSKCPERPVVKNFDVARVSSDRIRDSYANYSLSTVCWKMVRYLSL